MKKLFSINKGSIQRTELLKLFVDRDLFPSTQLAIANLMCGLTDQQKEEKARRIIDIIKSSKTESEILSRVTVDV